MFLACYGQGSLDNEDQSKGLLRILAEDLQIVTDPKNKKKSNYLAKHLSIGRRLLWLGFTQFGMANDITQLAQN